MELTITISEDKKSALKQRARAYGYTDVKKYVERLITTDLLAAKSFDELLSPVRNSFQRSGVSEEEMEVLFEEARDEIYEQQKANKK